MKFCPESAKTLVLTAAIPTDYIQTTHIRLEDINFPAVLLSAAFPPYDNSPPNGGLYGLTQR